MASVVKKVVAYNAGMPANLHDLKWKALQESPFRFFRGTDHIFAGDFVKAYKYKPKVKAWICGDLHFENFGTFKGENRLVYFDINDFDEAILAGPEPELTRFMSSIVIAAGMMKAPSLHLHKTLNDVLDVYSKTIQGRKALMLESEVAHGKFKKLFEQLEVRDRQAFIASRSTKHKGRITLKTDGVRYLPIDNELKKRIFDKLESLTTHHHNYEHLVCADAAFRIAGTGSLGLERYCVLAFHKKKGKHYLLDIKECRTSCFSNLIDVKQPKFANDAERVITSGYLMQYNAPAFLAPFFFNNKWFIIKELQPVSDKLALADFGSDFKGFSEVAGEMAALIGYSHLRSSGQFGSSTTDELCKFVSKKQWQRDLVDLSSELARKNNKYFKEFSETVSGR